MRYYISRCDNELTSGRVQDSNSAFISRLVQMQGWQVSAIVAVGDSEEAIRKSLESRRAVLAEVLAVLQRMRRGMPPAVLASFG